MKLFTPLMVSSVLFASSFANAGIVVDYKGTASDSDSIFVNSLMTSSLVNQTSFIDGQGTGLDGDQGVYFAETFDNVMGCGISLSGLNVTNDAGNLIYNNVSHGSGANPSDQENAPANTCFAATSPSGQVEGLSTWDFSGLQSTAASKLNVESSDAKVNYLGFLWGSIDDYNNFEFFDGNKSVLSIKGSDLINERYPNGGYQNGDDTDYVNLYFDEEASFTSFKLTSTGVAGEIDNIVVGFGSTVAQEEIRTANEVSEPSTLAMSALALLSLSFMRRRKSAK